MSPTTRVIQSNVPKPSTGFSEGVMTPHADLFQAARREAYARVQASRKRHAKTAPHLKALQDATTAALRWEAGARNG